MLRAPLSPSEPGCSRPDSPHGRPRAEWFILICIAVGIAFLPIPLLVEHGTPDPTRVGDESDLREVADLILAGVEDGSVRPGGAFGPGDTVSSSAGSFVVPYGMSGEIGTADFCVEADGYAITGRTGGTVYGGCDGLILRLRQPSVDRVPTD